MKILTVKEFFTMFPTDESCLSHLMKTRYGDVFSCPKCKKEGKFHRLKNLPAYGCQWCGHHIHPMAGTPFSDSHTPLQKWFYAMYLFTTSRHGVSAKELQRQLGVTYKTAWRMAHEIRKYMGKIDGDDGLKGHVEVDETWIGQKERTVFWRSKSKKTIVIGLVQRNGDIITKVIPNIKGKTVHEIIEKYIEKGSTISTDEYRSYKTLRNVGYTHGAVNHGLNEYVDGIHHVNTIEGYWSLLKRSIRGTHIHVSKKHMPSYLGEFEFRYNMRSTPEKMFSSLLAGF